MDNSCSVALIGLGNILLRDEGVGVAVIKKLQDQYRFDPPINIIDGGTVGFGLIVEIQDCHKIIIVDAVKADGEPGTIYRFTKNDIQFNAPQKFSAHNIGFLEVMQQWQMLGINPDVTIVGIEPQDISSWGMQLSECLQAKLPKLIAIVLEELENAGISTTAQP